MLAPSATNTLWQRGMQFTHSRKLRLQSTLANIYVQLHPVVYQFRVHHLIPLWSIFVILWGETAYIITIIRSVMTVEKAKPSFSTTKKGYLTAHIQNSKQLLNYIVQLSNTSLSAQRKQLQKHCHRVMWPLLPPLFKPNWLRAPS